MISSSERASGSRAYKMGVAVALVTAFATVWTTVVRDDGTGLGFFMVILAAAVGAIAALFRPAGMARAMVGVAIMQLLLGVGIATAPSTATIPNGPLNALLFSALVAVLWLTSASFFHAAGKGDR